MTAATLAKRGYTEAEAAVYLGLSPRFVRQLVTDGHLVARRPGTGKIKLYDVRDLDAYFEALPTERTAS